MSAPGAIVAAPASGSGKTVVTLGLLRALRQRGVAVGAAKVGPDYIDPAFQSAAAGRTCYNIDPWAMRAVIRDTVRGRAAAGADLLLVEGVMGLFDGAADGTGSTADLAAATGWPVILVVDCRGQGATAAAVVQGLARFKAGVDVAGAIFNRAGGARHRALIAAAMEEACPDVTVLGYVPRDDAMALPSRHLGLVQAGEHPDLERFLDAAAAVVAAAVDLDGLVRLARTGPAAQGNGVPVPPLGQTIAVARDEAFTFAYPAVLEGWRDAGAVLRFFSPLADEGPAADADAVFLPGGYPELHGGRLAAASAFRQGLGTAARRGAFVYGECGGYMVLGRALTDADGRRHAMADLLPLETSFAAPRLSLGYREAELTAALPLGPRGARYRGHAFHYAAVDREGPGAALFSTRDATGVACDDHGLMVGTVAGSFVHLIDRTEP